MHIKRAFHKVVHGVGEVGRGLADAGVDEAKGAVSVARHPVSSAKGVSRLVAHPTSTLAALGSDVAGPPDQRSGTRKAGEMAGHLGLDILSLGTAPVLHAASSVNRVSEAGNAREEVKDVKVGDVFKGAGGMIAEPAKETLDVVRHPKRTAEGLGRAAKHPMDIDEQPEAPVERSDGQRVGRGLVRLVGMGVAPVVPGLDKAQDAVEAGSKVDRITRPKD